MRDFITVFEEKVKENHWAGVYDCTGERREFICNTNFPLHYNCERCGGEVVDDSRITLFDTYYRFGVILCACCRPDFEQKMVGLAKVERFNGKTVSYTGGQEKGLITKKTWSEKTVSE